MLKKNNKMNNNDTTTTESTHVSHPGVDDTMPSAPSTAVGVFSDSVPAQLVGESSGKNPFGFSRPDDSDLNEYLRRPVIISSSTWSSSAFSEVDFYPWTLFFANPAVKNKLQGYNLLRGELHLRFSCTGNPFQYGLLQGCYCPGPVRTGAPATGLKAAIGIGRGSQLRHGYINGSTPSTFELVCPFIGPMPYVCLTTGAYGWSSDDIGHACLCQVVGLQSSTGATVIPSTVVISAWLENVELRVPTSISYAKDPVAVDGVVTKTAGLVAKAASALSALPELGWFFTPASIVAKGAESVARYFGWSRPVDPTGYHQMVARNVGALAITYGPDSIPKISSDPLQQLDLGRAWDGTPAGPDEMAIQSIVSRRCLVSDWITSWATTTASDTILRAIQVAPLSATNQSGAAFDMTPLAYATLPFSYWTGSIIYRMRIVCSPMMRGRLLVFHYPHNDAGYSSLTSATIVNTYRNVIFDTSCDQEMEFVVRPTTPSVWYNTNDLGAFPAGSGTMAPYDVGAGYIVVMVLQQLSAPAPCTASLIFDVHADKDFRVGAPCLSRVHTYRWSALAGDPIPMPDFGEAGACCKRIEFGPPVDTSRAEAPFFGETIASFRAMAKRYSISYYLPLQTSIVCPAIAALQTVYFRILRVMYVPARSGQWGTTTPNNFWTWMSYGAWPFFMTRGGVRVKARLAYERNATIGATMSGRLEIARSTVTPGVTIPAPDYTSSTYAVDDTINDSSKVIMSDYINEGDGAATVDLSCNNIIEAEIPYQSNRISCGYNDYLDVYGTAYPGSVVLSGEFTCPVAVTANTVTNLKTMLTFMDAAADDFDCREWIGVGTLTRDTPPPLAYSFNRA